MLSVSRVNSSRNSLKEQPVGFCCGQQRMTRHKDTVEMMNSADKNSNDFGVRPVSVKRTLNPVLYLLW